MQKIIFSLYRFVFVPCVMSLTLWVASLFGKAFADKFPPNFIDFISNMPFVVAYQESLRYVCFVWIFLIMTVGYINLYRITMDDTSEYAYAIVRMWTRIAWRKITLRIIAVMTIYDIISTIVTTVLYSMPHVEKFEPYLSVFYNIEDGTRWIILLLAVLLYISTKKGE